MKTKHPSHNIKPSRRLWIVGLATELMVVMPACAGNLSLESLLNTDDSFNSLFDNPAANASSIKIIFRYDNFTNLRDSTTSPQSFVPPYSTTAPFSAADHIQGSFAGPNSFSCPGDITSYYYADATNYDTILGENPLTPGETYQPTWIKHVAVDVTDAKRDYDSADDSDSINDNEAYSCSFQTTPGAPPSSACARFDFEALDFAPNEDTHDLIKKHDSTETIGRFCSVDDSVAGGEDDLWRTANGADAGPSDDELTYCHYYTGYYTTYDQECTDAGPLSSGDSDVSKLLAGGAYILLDRASIGGNENLLLHLKYFSAGQYNYTRTPASATDVGNNLFYGFNEQMYFRVHLVSTGLSKSELSSLTQPRYFHFTDDLRYPVSVETAAILGSPTGGIREEQVFIPLAGYPSTDMIRIERYSGTAVLLEATLHRLGDR